MRRPLMPRGRGADNTHMRFALRSDNGRVTPERDPRLVLRFAVAVGVCLTLAAVAIILVIRYLNLVEAEKNAGRHARYVAHAILQNAVEDGDFGPSSDAGRRATLDGMFRSQVLVDGTLLALLVRPDGTIAYATDTAAESGLAIDRERVTDALAGTVTSTDDDLRLASAGGTKATRSSSRTSRRARRAWPFSTRTTGLSPRRPMPPSCRSRAPWSSSSSSSSCCSSPSSPASRSAFGSSSIRSAIRRSTTT